MTQALTVTEASLRHAPWSFSKMETGESCPAQFKHKHVLRTVAGPSAPETVVGTAAHEVLEHRVKGASLADAKRAALANTPLTSDEQDMLRTLEDRMEAFVRKFDGFCRREGVTRILVEEAWGITASLGGTGFFDKDVFFRGKVDLGAVTRDGDLVVIDHKSGVAKDLKRDQKKRQQLWSYYVLAVANVPGVSGVRGAIHFLQGDEDKAVQWMPSYDDASRVRAVYAPWLFSRISEVAATLVEPFPARPKIRWPCEWCTYQGSCDPFQRTYGGQTG
jgi:hypothetical protein